MRSRGCVDERGVSARERGVGGREHGARFDGQSEPRQLIIQVPPWLLVLPLVALGDGLLQGPPVAPIEQAIDRAARSRVARLDQGL